MTDEWRSVSDRPSRRIRVRWRGTVGAVRRGATVFYAERRRFSGLGHYGPNGIKELDGLPPDPEDRTFEFWQQVEEGQRDRSLKG
jgi:hypothetical protein